MNILLTSAGRRSYLVEYFKEALGGSGKVVACNSSKDSTALLAADHGIESPLIYSDEYVPFLQDVIQQYDIELVISLFDADLPVLSQNKRALESTGARVLISAPEVIEVCNDKAKTYQFLQRHGISAPATFVNLADALTALAQEEIQYPVVVKPRWGMGSMSIFIADNDEELRVFYAKSRRQIFETYLKYESQTAPDACVIIQEFVAGNEYGLDVVNDMNGQYVTTSVKKKLAMRSGETDGAVTVNVPELQHLGQQLGTLLGHIGNLDVDVLERGGKYFVLELNARFGGGYPFSHLAGMGLPAEILRWCRGMRADASRLQVREGVFGLKDIVPRVSPIHNAG